MIWIIGEYAGRIENADELLTSFLETFHDETAVVQLQLLTATVKLFLKKPAGNDALVRQPCTRYCLPHTPATHSTPLVPFCVVAVGHVVSKCGSGCVTKVIVGLHFGVAWSLRESTTLPRQGWALVVGLTINAVVVAFAVCRCNVC